MEELKDQSRTKKHLKRYSFSYIFIGFVIGVLLISEALLNSTFQSYDLELIKKIQKAFPQSLYDNSTFKAFAWLLSHYTDSYFFNALLAFLYCSFNPFVSFKIALFSNLAVYFHTVLIVVMYQEPRPHWIDSNIKTSSCQPIFSGPAYNQFMGTLLMLYTITVFHHYQALKNFIFQALFTILMVSINVFATGFAIINGHSFIYQVVFGIIMGIVVVFIANALDDSISLLTLKVGFFSKSSKKYTFLLLVILLFVFSLCLVYTIVAESITLILPDWLEHYKVSLG